MNVDFRSDLCDARSVSGDTDVDTGKWVPGFFFTKPLFLK